MMLLSRFAGSVDEMSACDFCVFQVAFLHGSPRIASQLLVNSDGVLRGSIRTVYSQSLILSGKDVSRVRISSIGRRSTQPFGDLSVLRCRDIIGSELVYF